MLQNSCGCAAVRQLQAPPCLGATFQRPRTLLAPPPLRGTGSLSHRLSRAQHVISLAWGPLQLAHPVPAHPVQSCQAAWACHLAPPSHLAPPPTPRPPSRHTPAQLAEGSQGCCYRSPSRRSCGTRPSPGCTVRLRNPPVHRPPTCREGVAWVGEGGVGTVPGPALRLGRGLLTRR